MRNSSVVVLSVSCLVVSAGAARAQGRGGPEWMTTGGDAQRSSWIRSDPKISAERLQKPGFALDWKIKLNGEPSLASTLDRYIGFRGFRSFALMGSNSGELTAIDTDLGRVEWQKKIAGPAAPASAGCPGGMTSNVARATTAAFPAAPVQFGGGGGRGGPAKSAVGTAGEGAVTIVPAMAAADPGRGRGAPGAPGGGGLGRTPALLSVLAGDGMYHSLYVSNGEEPAAPMAFLPPNANARGLIVVDNVAYAATSQGCGGAPNAVWALDLESKQVSHWAAMADIAGGGFALGPDATVYAATSGGELVALAPKNLQVKNTYRAAGQSFSSSPLVIEHKGKALIAVATKDGHVHLVDSASLEGTAYSASASGALATWKDASGTDWIVAPAKSSIVAWKILDQGDKLALQPGWTSAEMGSPFAPIIVNGVVFAVSNSPAAVLHAIDGNTGKELWNSGKTMTAAVKNDGLSGSGSQLYLGTSDGMIYAFGFPIEH